MTSTREVAMPRSAPKTATQEPRRTRRARARIARNAERLRAASGPADQHRVAAEYLLSAVGNAPQPDREVRRILRTYEPDVRELLTHTQLAGKRAQLYRDQLDASRAPRAQLALVLRLLRAVCDHLDDPPAAHAHYVQLLADEARRVDTAHLPKGGET